MSIRNSAEWFLGELPSDCPLRYLRKEQGKIQVRRLLDKEREREITSPSGPILNYTRRGIVWLNYLRIQFWIDHLRDQMAFRVLGRTHRTIIEIASWRDRYYVLRFWMFVFFLWFLGLPSVSQLSKVAVCVVSLALVLDIFGGLAGSALVWHSESVSHQRNLLISLINYAEIVVAFAGFYRTCRCLNIEHPSLLQSLYFSTVVATTLGFGDIIPSSTVGRLLIIAQLFFFVIFLVVLVNILSARALTPSDHPAKMTRLGMSPEEITGILGTPPQIANGDEPVYIYERLRVQFRNSRVVDVQVADPHF